VARAPSWKTLEILGGFASPDEARAVLREVKATRRFQDRRFDADWLDERLEELDG
jgi:hypothetical protein